jgi:cytochrome b6-f complex iron-sulfur subunit
VDVGAATDFDSTTTNPKQIQLPVAAKTDQQTAFIIKIAGQYQAISNICTHQGCEISWVASDNLYECPCHGSKYDLSGKNVAGPAPRPLAHFKTQVVNGRLLVSYDPINAGS